MAERAKAHRSDPAKAVKHSEPKQGETYRCEVCGLELEITADCHCQDPNGPYLECCGRELTRT